ncbi:putative restriction endonuclease [Pseudarthrobacter phenanthrenivorans Sphe3]|uniref:Putative restriction endonuclease n=1 Tax=Pseudarthrobacter phenanthrenivorans (strain DSM 18606 / JCM 16027 / LMG 23796 / Sphe3) TaxID=930171 RepID=F0M351_PSEPM|nr:putative restriction endonuclease [Pseudarthrobacter phenanthrenivorans Sphe3]
MSRYRVPAVILGWNPRGRKRWDYRAAVEQVAESGRFLQPWGVGHLEVGPGTEAWLLVQGGTAASTGLIGHGVVVSETYEAGQQGDPATRRHVSVAFDALLPLGEQVPQDALTAAVPEVAWGGAARLAATAVGAAAEPGLRQLWRDRMPPAGDPPLLPAGTYPPQAVTRIEVNRYERNQDARRICLAFHGTSCAACGFSFEASYGDIGAGFIEVHHLVPPALLGSTYQLDPIADLVPLCSNCHAMAHHNVASPRTVSELRSLRATSGFLAGEVVSSRALQAQDDAQRILGGRQD